MPDRPSPPHAFRRVLILITAFAFLAIGLAATASQNRASYLPAVFGVEGIAATQTPEATASMTATETATATATVTPSATATATASATPTATATATVSPTPTASATSTSTATEAPTASSTPTQTATPTQTPTATATLPPGEELLVFDWNRPVTTADHGFPWDKPPLPSANGDWTQPINFAQGTLHLRAEIRSQPVPQPDMKMQFCFWQYASKLETCSPLSTVPGTSGTVVTWSVAISKMWKKDGNPLEWWAPRDRNGVSIKNKLGEPVSDYSGYDWSGEDPAAWYPLDMRFTVVVVEKGKSFSGWDNYIP